MFGVKYQTAVRARRNPTDRKPNAIRTLMEPRAEPPLSNPATEKPAHDWDDFLDMSDPAEAYDWLDRHNIKNRKVQDELVGLWDLDADVLDIQDTFDMIGRQK